MFDSMTVERLLLGCCVCIAACCFPNHTSAETQTMELPWKAGSKERIIEWAKHNGTSHRLHEYRDGEKRALVTVIDVASGVRRDHICIHVWERGEWHLILYRVTNTSVEVRYAEGLLVFKSGGGDVLLELPMKGLQYYRS